MSPPRTVVVRHDRHELAEATRRLGAELSAAYPDGFMAVAVLTGSLLFSSDVVRRVSVACEVDFLAISPYAPGTGRVRLLKDLAGDVAGRHVVVMEDIVDTGLTSAYLLAELRGRGARSVEVCALFDRRVRRIVPVAPRFVGFEADDELLLGYGLDIGGWYRNLPFVAVGDPEVLTDRPDAYVEALYGL